MNDCGYLIHFRAVYGNILVLEKLRVICLGGAYESGPRHIKFSLYVRLQNYLKVRSDVYYH